MRFSRMPMLCLLLLYSIATKAQELLFQNVSEQVAVPTSECYNVNQDSRGYMWISTAQGLVRYDRSGSVVYDQKNGLPEKATYAVTEDHNGTMWFATSKNRLMQYRDGELAEAEISKNYQRQMPKGNITFAFTNTKKDIYINTYAKTFQIAPTGKLSVFKPLPLSTANNIVFLKPADRLISFNDNFHSVYMPKDEKGKFEKVTILISTPKGDRKLDIPYHEREQLLRRILTCHIQGYNFFTINNKLVRLAPDFSYQVIEMPGNVICLYADKKGGLWVGMAKGGFVYYRDGKQLQQPIKGLSNYSVSGIHVDVEQSIWCTTLENGVYFSKSTEVLSYSNLPALSAPVNMMVTIGKQLYVSPQFGGLWQLQSGQQLRNIITQPYLFYHLFHIQKNRYLLATADGGFTTETTFKHLRTLPVQRYSPYHLILHYTIYDHSIGPKNSIYSISYTHILKYGPNGFEPLIPVRSVGRCIGYIGGNRLLYGCSDGLYVMNLKTLHSRKIKGIERAVHRILPSSDGTCWIATAGDGLYQLQHGEIRRLDQRLGIPTAIFYDILEDKKGIYWAATNKGLFRIDINGASPGISHYDTNHGLPSNEIYKLALNNDQLFFSSPAGLSSLPINGQLANRTAPRFHIKNLRIDRAQQPLETKDFELDYGSNEIVLSLHLSSYKNEQTRLFYRLQRTDPYLPMNGTDLRLQNLSPNRYELSVYALNGDGVKSENMIQLPFIVKKPFWQTLPFFFVLSILLCGVFFGLKKLQLNAALSKEKEKSKVNILIAESKLSALQARMNPHFISNAINSIQRYILKNQADEAQHYLTKFSRLIRMVLQQSAERFLTLQKEIETLTLYLELEKLRFREAFEYRITLAPEIHPHELLVPTMLLQPYVENAIWHGLIPLEGERRGQLNIHVGLSLSGLKISIEDNGIGRQRAMNYQKEDYRLSSGMMLTEDRLQALQQIFSEGNFQVSVIDLYDPKQLGIGTRVEITLSILPEYPNS